MNSRRSQLVIVRRMSFIDELIIVPSSVFTIIEVILMLRMIDRRLNSAGTIDSTEKHKIFTLRKIYYWL